MGNQWTLQDAKNKFSAVVEAARKGVPQHVTKHGADAVVVLSAEEYRRLAELDKDRKPKKTLLEHLLGSPRLPGGMDDIFDDRDGYPSALREIDLED
ncbi:type II toxin-antitoxin system Phd/YefM family antitoxin [Jiella sp. M17.18]|uniref:type II toxin-antitoxin system Phd/YefM family antitoxin n=1 Tax=Jiella sp. M17.18 TaxID=3234247 RepID=UPI0034DF2B72